MDTSKSSVSSQHYATLLSTVSELRNDLEKTLGKIQSLESSNHLLSTNYQALKDELIETRKKHNELTDIYMRTVQEKFDAEEKYENVIDHVQSQLAEKTEEFEQIRDKLIPHDIDHLKIKVQEELEMKHKQQLQSIESELTLQRDHYYSLRRESERVKCENEIVIQHLQHEIVALRTEKVAVEDLLRAEIVRSKELELTNNPATHESTTVSTKELELKFMVEHLKNDLHAGIAERDTMNMTLHTVKSECQTICADLRSQIAILTAEKSGLQESLSKNIIDLELSENALNECRGSLEDTQGRIARMQKDQRAAEMRVETQRVEFNQQMDELQIAHNNEIQELQRSLDSVQSLLAEREAALRQAQRDAIEMQTIAESSERELRRTHLLQSQEFRRRLSVLEVQLAESEHTIKSNESSNNTALAQTKFECDGAKSELSRIKREKDILQSKLRDLEAAAAVDKHTISVLQSESHNKIASLEKDVDEARSKVGVLEKKLSETKEQLTVMQTRAESALQKNEKFEMMHDEDVKQIEAYRRDTQTQLDAFKVSFTDKYETMYNKLSTALAAEKKRSEGYKSKALAAHARVKAVTLGGQLNAQLLGAESQYNHLT